MQKFYRNHGKYVSAVVNAVRDNVKNDFITLKGARDTKVEAAQADVPPKE